jgi:Ca2+-binding RTX toxin-like protein
MVYILSGLGGSKGFGEGVLDRNDDSYTQAIDITSVFENGLNFFGTNYEQMFVNNNGSVTFNYGLSAFTPQAITAATTAGLFAFWADVDTRGGAVARSPGGNSKGSNLVYYDLAPAQNRITITWDDVGYYSNKTDKLNAFQIVIRDLSDVAGYRDGDFTFEYRYETLNWTTGSASGGVNGFGGNIARAGFSSANNVNYFEMPGSGLQQPALTWDTRDGNTGTPGLWRFTVRNAGDGADTLTGRTTDDVLNGGAGNDVIRGYAGNDYLSGGLGNDRLFGGLHNDRLFGDDGNDYLSGGYGNDYLSGGAGRDTLLGNAGRDTLNGGLDNDRLNGGTGVDTAEFNTYAATVRLGVTGWQNTGHGYDLLTSIENLTGGAYNDRLAGNGAANVIDGAAGNDTILGWGGNDRIFGGLGDDRMTGGAGRDAFVFRTLDEMGTLDRITDFRHGIDRINLAAIDGLEFIGRAAFTAEAMQVRFNAGQHRLEVNSDTDTDAEYMVYLTGVSTFTAMDIVL